jgi:hypothetical protein
MPTVDMSAEAITARLKLASELRDLCLLLGTAKIETESEVKKDDMPQQGRDQPTSRDK